MPDQQTVISMICEINLRLEMLGATDKDDQKLKSYIEEIRSKLLDIHRHVFPQKV